LFSSFDLNSGKVVMTSALGTGATIFFRMRIQPDVIVNFAHVDYIEIGKTPAVVIESISVKGGKVVAFKELVDKANEKGYQLRKPFRAESITFVCSILTGGIRDSLRIWSSSMSAIMATGLSGQNPCLLHTVALDEKVTMYYDMNSRYNPKPNFSHLIVSSFSIVIRDFYIWVEDVAETAIVKQFNFSPVIDSNVDGPEPIGNSPLTAGAVSYLSTQPNHEDGWKRSEGT